VRQKGKKEVSKELEKGVKDDRNMSQKEGKGLTILKNLKLCKI
jgi:hypothetical protein